MKKNVLHYPRLDTVLMVEKTIKKHSGELKKKQLWNKLPKKMMYQTYSLIIDYLIESGKMFISKDKTLVWTYDPVGIRKIISKGVKVR